MHELSVCQGLVRQVLAIGRDQPGRISRVGLRIGPLSGVDPGLLTRAYPVATAGTEAAGSELMIEAAPVRVHCATCGSDTEASMQQLTCAVCGDWQTTLLSGDELLLLSVELEEPAHV